MILTILKGEWDAADAVAEGLHVHDILIKWDRIVAKNKPRRPDMIPLYSVADLRADTSPMPEDLIAPRLLTPGGMLVFGGAPKVGKSDFLIALLANMAAGEDFLGLSAKQPLRVFYLQAEVQYHYLRERIQRLRLPDHALDCLQQNFVMTPQVRLILNEDGIHQIVQSVKGYFGDSPPDIIAVDPIRNVFDGGGVGGENDNDAMMFFLSQRVGGSAGTNQSQCRAYSCAPYKKSFQKACRGRSVSSIKRRWIFALLLYLRHYIAPPG